MRKLPVTAKAGLPLGKPVCRCGGNSRAVPQPLFPDGGRAVCSDVLEIPSGYSEGIKPERRLLRRLRGRLYHPVRGHARPLPGFASGRGQGRAVGKVCN